METRKVQKVGYSTLTISLPSDWVKQNKISAGDTVFIMPEKNGTIKIMSTQALPQELGEYVINADACNEPGLLERIIVGNYIHGHDFIRITSQNRIGRSHTNEIRRIVRKLIGLGIIEEDPKNILLQCSVDPTKFKIDMLTRRLCMLSSTMLSESMQALLEKNKTLAEEAIKREDEADAIYYLAVRLLLSAQMKHEIADKIGIDNVLVIPATRLILQYLELTADYAEDVAKNVILLLNYKSKLPNDTIKEIYEICEKTKIILQKAIGCFFARDLRCANRILEMKKKLEVETERVTKEFPEIPYMRTIVSTLSKIADKGATIAEIAINRALEEPDKYVKDIIQKVKS